MEWTGLFLVQISTRMPAFFPCHRAELGSRKGLTPTGTPGLDNSQLKHQRRGSSFCNGDENNGRAAVAKKKF